MLCESRQIARIAVLCLAVLTLSERLSAQPAPLYEQQSELAAKLLASPYWSDKAWGIYIGARMQKGDFHERLKEQLQLAIALRSFPSGTEERAFIHVLFDALIESGTPVPASLLEPFAQVLPGPVLVMLARGGEDSEGVLLQLHDKKSPDMIWLAANNLLANRKSQPWYAALLTELEITHKFVVTDPSGGSGESRGGGIYRCAIAAKPPGFPPVTLYALTDSKARGNVLLATGPTDIYYATTVVPPNRQVSSSAGASVLDRTSIQIGYLAQLASYLPEQATNLFRATTQIVYTTREQLGLTLNRSLAGQQQGIIDFLKRMSSRGLITPQVTLRIRPQILDRRQAPNFLLPEVRAVEFTIP